jgi:hypothetical protein
MDPKYLRNMRFAKAGNKDKRKRGPALTAKKA